VILQKIKIVAILAFACIAVSGALYLSLANFDNLKMNVRPVSSERLASLIGNANRVVVTESPFQDAKKLFESRDRKDLDALSKALEVTESDELFHCMCIGTPAIYIYKDEELLTEVTNHHGQSVRCTLWSSDACIKNVEVWLKWFDDRKIDGPRLEVNKRRKNDEQSHIARKKWIAAMPKGLDRFWESSLGQFGDVDTKPLAKALRASIPKRDDQILALLRWFGSGAGPWSGYPTYEQAAETLLLEYQLSEIISCVEIKNLSAEQIEGAARFLGGWHFAQKHPKGSDQLPVEIKKALLEHVRYTKDEDKLERAKNAFKAE
jgi:hypothetical protein